MNNFEDNFEQLREHFRIQGPKYLTVAVNSELEHVQNINSSIVKPDFSSEISFKRKTNVTKLELFMDTNNICFTCTIWSADKLKLSVKLTRQEGGGGVLSRGISVLFSNSRN